MEVVRDLVERSRHEPHHWRFRIRGERGFKSQWVHDVSRQHQTREVTGAPATAGESSFMALHGRRVRSSGFRAGGQEGQEWHEWIYEEIPYLRPRHFGGRPLSGEGTIS